MTDHSSLSARRSTADRRLRGIAPLSLSLAGALLLTGCGGGSAPGPSPEAYSGTGDSEALSVVNLEVAEDGTPTVSLESPVEAEEDSTRVLASGDGEEIEDGDLAQVKTAIVDPTTGEIMATNFTSEPELVMVNQALKDGNEALYDALEKNRVGSQTAYYVPANAEQGSTTGQLMVFQIVGTSPDHAEGTAVEDVDPALPAVTLNEETGEPSIATPEGEAPTELTVQPLIQGDGATVGADDAVTVRYKGIKWSDGTEFDSNWAEGKQLTPFSLNQVITGWKEGLAGQKVGSQVLLVIPPAQAYGEAPAEGEEATSELQGQTLVFVVDILATTPPVESAPAPSESSSAEPEASPAPSGSAAPSESASPSDG